MCWCICILHVDRMLRGMCKQVAPATTLHLPRLHACKLTCWRARAYAYACRILCCHRSGTAALAELPEPQQAALLQAHFLFALVWSLGANTDDEGRRRFDGALRRLLAGDVPPELAAFVKAPPVRCWGCCCHMHVR